MLSVYEAEYELTSRVVNNFIAGSNLLDRIV